MKEQIIEKVFSDRKSIFYRGLSILLSSIFFANIPLLLFLIYMGVNGFFSYDFFSEGIFGLKVFFFLTSIFVLILSISFFGFVIFLVEKWKKKKFNKLVFYPVLIANILFITFFILISVIKSHENSALLMGLYIGIIGFSLSFHIAFLLHAKPKEQFGTLLIVIFIVTALSLNFREQASLMLENALKTYGVGGNIEVNLVPKLFDTNKITGRLVLLSPRYIYIKLDTSNNISTISRERFDVITKNHPPTNK